MVLSVLNVKDLPLLRIFYIIKMILNIVLIIIPIILIIMGSIDLVKALINQNKGDTKKNINILIKRLEIGVAIFFIMPIVSLIMIFAGQKDFSKTKYWVASTKEMVDTLTIVDKTQKTKQAIETNIKKLKTIQKSKIQKIMNKDNLETPYSDII